MKQLLLFDMEKSPTQEIKELKQEWERTRKSLYARQADIIKKQQELLQRYEIMETYICKGKLL